MLSGIRHAQEKIPATITSVDAQSRQKQSVEKVPRMFQSWRTTSRFLGKPGSGRGKSSIRFFRSVHPVQMQRVSDRCLFGSHAACQVRGLRTTTGGIPELERPGV